jgi:uncharacterized membrane protein
VRDTLRQQQRQNNLSLDDSAVVVKDQDGNVKVRDEVDRGVKIGAVGGGALGVLIGGFFFPLAGLVLGALGGGVLGALADMGIQKSFVKDVSDAMPNGSSALFFIVRDAYPDAAIAALRPYKGTVHHTSLPPQAEENLRDVLSRRIE